MKTIAQLREKRASLIEEGRTLVERAEKEDRNLSADEKESYDRIFRDAAELKERIDRLERQREEERGAELLGSEKHLEADQERRGGQSEAEFRAQAFEKYIVQGERALSEAERRALSVSDAGDGGNTVKYEEFVADLITDIDNMAYIRGLATRYTLKTAKQLTIPKLNTDIEDPTWTTENAAADEDTAMDFAQVILDPNPAAKFIKVSKTLLRESALNVVDIVRSRMAYKFAIALENKYLNGAGSGSNEPLGVFTASASGISTGRDVAFSATTAFDSDALISAKYTLKRGYRAQARWLMHRDGVSRVAKLKDTEGDYIWKAGIAAGEPDTLLGFPILESEYAPNTFTAGLYAAILGDFSHYYVCDALDMEIQRLDELYAINNQVGFVGRMESDGIPANENAFVRVKMAAS